jgi:hypothetical protein
MRKILTSTIACLFVTVLLLTGSMPVALGESAAGDNAQSVPGGDMQTPGDVQPMAGGDVSGDGVSNSDIVYYAAATGTSAITGIIGGVGAGTAIGELLMAARIEAIVASPVEGLELVAALTSAKTSTMLLGSLAGAGIGLLVTGLIFFVFFACNYWG